MINKTSENTKMAILRKTPFAHSTRPSDDGMPAAQVKKMFYTAIADEENSILAEMERMRQEANADFDAKVNLDKMVDRVEDHVDSHHLPSTLGLTRYVDQVGNVLRLFYSGLIVKPDDWTALSTPVGTYGYAATIALPNVTEAMIPELCFAPEDAVRAQLATFCQCVAGGVVVYATEALEQPVTVATLLCSVPTYFTVLVRADHADVTIVDAAGKQYQSGDFAALGANLSVRVTPEVGYGLSQFDVNGTTYSAQTTVNYVVSGTLVVEATAEEVTP